MKPYPALAYTRKGAGAPLVLLHGFGHRRQVWDPIIDQLAEHFDVIAVDQAGFGWSPALPWGMPHGVANMTAALLHNFQRWGIDQPHLVGNSAGGAIALELAAAGHAKSVTALSPMGFRNWTFPLITVPLFVCMRIVSLVGFPKLAKWWLNRRRLRSLSFWILHTHPERVRPEVAYGEAMSFRYSTAYERAGLRFVNYRFSRPVTVPTTIAWGTRDRVLPYSQAPIAAQRLPQAKHLPLPDCGHIPVIDHPDLVLATIIETTQRAA